MNAIGTIVILAAIGGVGYGLYKVYNQNKAPKIQIEKVSTISMKDVVAWFKSQNLNPQQHTPFIANSVKAFANVVKEEPHTPYIILGVFNEGNSTLSPLKILLVENLDPEISKMLESSNNGIVVLS